MNNTMTPLCDEEVICYWMEPGGIDQPFEGLDTRHPYHWWSWYMRFPAGLESTERRHKTCDLTLDRLHQVETKLLTTNRWIDYLGALERGASLNERLTALVHASAAQKIAALAQTIRAMS